MRQITVCHVKILSHWLLSLRECTLFDQRVLCTWFEMVSSVPSMPRIPVAIIKWMSWKQNEVLIVSRISRYAWMEHGETWIYYQDKPLLAGFGSEWRKGRHDELFNKIRVLHDDRCFHVIATATAAIVRLCAISMLSFSLEVVYTQRMVHVPLTMTTMFPLLAMYPEQRFRVILLCHHGNDDNETKTNRI